MGRSLLTTGSAIFILGITGAGNALAFGVPGGGGGLPGLGGGGGGTDSLTEQAKVRTVNSIIYEVGKTAFEKGKIVGRKQQWACKRLKRANTILQAINKPKLTKKVNKLRKTLYCGISEKIPPSMLAPTKKKIDTQET